MKNKDGILEYIWTEWKIIDGTFYKNCKIVLFEWRNYIISNNAVLTIQTTPFCNAKCKFCFNWITFYPNSHQRWLTEYLKKVIYFSQISEIKAVWISWWEPTMDTKYLISLVSYLSWRFKDIILHSNWINLFHDYEGSYLIDALINLWVNKLTLSLADFDNENNKKLMNFRWDYQWLSLDEISKLWKYSDKCSIRLSCFLNKQWIWSLNDVLNYINFWIKNWIKNFIFRAASNSKTPSLYLKDTDFYRFSVDNIKNIDDYLDGIEDCWFKQVFSLHKSDIHVHSFKNDDICVEFEEVTEELDNDNKIRRIIYYPNDVAYKSWIDPVSVIFEEDKNKIIGNILKTTILKSNNYPASPYLTLSLKEREKKKSEWDLQFPVDLHVHTINSDGKKTFKEVLSEAKKYNVKKLCITEHNFVSENYFEMVKLAKSFWIDIDFPWIEVNVVTHVDWKTPDRKHHLLCYGNWLLNKDFLNYISRPLQIKNAFYYDQVEKLKKRWYELPSFDNMLKWIDEDWNFKTPYKRLMTRSCIASYLSKITWETIDIVKEKYLVQLPEDITYKEYLRAEDVIPIIKDLWWVCWLAHPWWDRPFFGRATNLNLDYFHLVSEILRLKNLWLDWIEVYHKAHTEETKWILENLCRELMLLVVWWSDYHGKNKTRPEYFDICPWTFWLTFNEYNRIINLLKKD